MNKTIGPKKSSGAKDLETTKNPVGGALKLPRSAEPTHNLPRSAEPTHN